MAHQFASQSDLSESEPRMGPGVSWLLGVLLALRVSPTRTGVENSNGSRVTQQITVSGVSSGGFFAVQFHVAYSSIIRGAGIIAGGPFYCAQGNVDIALASCMRTPGLISVDELVAITHSTYLTTRTIDDPKNLSMDTKVWLFTGTEDTVVNPGVVHKLQSYYGNFGVDEIKLVDTVPAEHSWVTDSYGNSCSFKGEPYINNCGYNAANELLTYLHSTSGKGNLSSTSVHTSLNNFTGTNKSSKGGGKLVKINQKTFVPPGVIPAAIGLHDTAYAFLPDGCSFGGQNCDIHVAFHGCLQGIPKIGMQFVNNTGLNEVAAAYNIIVLYPQAMATLTNPKGCWDWWGYSGEDYSSQLGVQMKTVKAMLDSIR